MAELLTVEEVCAWFKVKKAWVHDEVEAHRLLHYRLRRKLLRFDRDDLAAYPEERAHRRDPTT